VIIYAGLGDLDGTFGAARNSLSDQGDMFAGIDPVRLDPRFARSRPSHGDRAALPGGNGMTRTHVTVIHGAGRAGNPSHSCIEIR
jgi:hypothetical protein